MPLGTGQPIRRMDSVRAEVPIGKRLNKQCFYTNTFANYEKLKEDCEA